MTDIEYQTQLIELLPELYQACEDVRKKCNIELVPFTINGIVYYKKRYFRKRKHYEYSNSVCNVEYYEKCQRLRPDIVDTVFELLKDMLVYNECCEKGIEPPSNETKHMDIIFELLTKAWNEFAFQEHRDDTQRYVLEWLHFIKAQRGFQLFF